MLKGSLLGFKRPHVDIFNGSRENRVIYIHTYTHTHIHTDRTSIRIRDFQSLIIEWEYLSSYTYTHTHYFALTNLSANILVSSRIIEICYGVPSLYSFVEL